MHIRNASGHECSPDPQSMIWARSRSVTVSTQYFQNISRLFSQSTVQIFTFEDEATTLLFSLVLQKASSVLLESTLALDVALACT